jgi:hypothetical protein
MIPKNQKNKKIAKLLEYYLIENKVGNHVNYPVETKLRALKESCNLIPEYFTNKSFKIKDLAGFFP